MPEPKQSQTKKRKDQPRTTERGSMLAATLEQKLEQIQVKGSKGRKELPKTYKRGGVLWGDKANTRSEAGVGAKLLLVGKHQDGWDKV